ncbi:MAG: hypothetical protein WBD95_23035 [Xanthobacteraceae bacterium]
MKLNVTRRAITVPQMVRQVQIAANRILQTANRAFFFDRAYAILDQVPGAELKADGE